MSQWEIYNLYQEATKLPELGKTKEIDMKLFIILAALFDGFGNEHINSYFKFCGVVVVLFIIFLIFAAIVGG